MSFRTTIIIDLEAPDAKAVLNARYKLERAIDDLRYEFMRYKDRALIHASFGAEIREATKPKAAG